MSRPKRLIGRRTAMCSNCPFHETGDGRFLRDSLSPGRFEGILADLKAEKAFPCHQDYGLVCAGSIVWQVRNGCVPQMIQVAERLEAAKNHRKARY